MSDFGLAWMTIPAICELASRRQWVCWRRQKRKGKWTKVPFQPDGKPASATNPKTWNELPTCFAALVAGKFDGVGYVLTPDDGIICIDLDHCFGKDGTLEPWARAIVTKVDSYTEYSPGDGLHVWAKANVTFAGRRHEGVEVYSSGRYITVTARHFEGTPVDLRDATDAVEKIVADFPNCEPPETSHTANFTIDPAVDLPGLKFHVLIENDRRFKASWNHKRKDLGDESLSSYDMSLATLAAYAQWTDQEIADLIIVHRREHGNPEKGLRQDYLQRTIARARHATIVKLKDFEAAEVHRTGETREVQVEEGLAELSTLLAINVQRVVQRGLDPTDFTLETDGEDIHIGSAEILLSPAKARARIIAKSPYIPKMTTKAWERCVALICNLREQEEVAEGQRDQEAALWVRSYLADRGFESPETTAQLAKFIELGEFPLQWEGKTYIRTVDLKPYIFSILGEKVPISTLCLRLREIGCVPHLLQIKQGSKPVKARTWVINPNL